MRLENQYKFNRSSRLGNNATSHMNDCYDAGYIQAISDYGVWKDGTQVIGCMETPVREVVSFIENINNAEL